MNSKRNSQRICKHILFFATYKADAQKNKKSLQANAPASADFRAKLDTTALRTDRKAADNNGFKKLAVQWLNEHLSFVSSSLLADSFVLRNPPLRQAPNRYS